MADSKQIAGLVGPTLIAILVSEFPLVQPHLYDGQIPPVVYLSGVLMFVAGLAIVRSHNIWARNWTVLVTLTGWFFLVLGLVRMFAAGQYSQAAAGTRTAVFMVIDTAGHRLDHHVPRLSSPAQITCSPRLAGAEHRSRVGAVGYMVSAHPRPRSGSAPPRRTAFEFECA